MTNSETFYDSRWLPHELYRTIHAHMPILCVDVSVVKTRNILLVKRTIEPMQGEWWFPGGRVHKHEPLEVTAQRIVWNETHLVVSRVKRIDVFEFSSDQDPFGHGQGTRTVSIFFRAWVLDGPVELDRDQASEARWWDGETMIEPAPHPIIVEMSRKALSVPYAD